MECFQLGIDLQLKPCVVTYTPVIDSFARAGKGAEAERYFLAMHLGEETVPLGAFLRIFVPSCALPVLWFYVENVAFYSQ